MTVNYRGTFIDGTEFDSSYKRNQPATLRVNGVIPGWPEALPMMKTGSKWRIFVPAKLAYGEGGARVIPPNATLIFDVELLSVVDDSQAGNSGKAMAGQTADPAKGAANKPGDRGQVTVARERALPKER